MKADDTEFEGVGRRPCVLVADDDDDIRALVVAAMKCDGYDVLEARDGREVIHMMSTQRRAPDIIITDVRMPYLNGLSLLLGLRSDGCMTPIVVMTAYGPDRIASLAGRLGADVTFGKPFDIDELRAAVMNMLRPNGTQVFMKTLPDSS